MHSAIGNWTLELNAAVVQPGWLPRFSCTGILNISRICAHKFHRNTERFGFEGTSKIVSFQTSATGRELSTGRISLDDALLEGFKPNQGSDAPINSWKPPHTLQMQFSRRTHNFPWSPSNPNEKPLDFGGSRIRAVQWLLIMSSCRKGGTDNGVGECFMFKSIHILEHEALILKVSCPHSV